MAVILNSAAVKELPIQWRDRKRTLFGLPLSFTVYILDEEVLHIKKGFLNVRMDDIKLYRIMDMTLTRSLGQRLFGLGTIHCCSSDKTAKDFDIKNVKRSQEVMNLLSQLVEDQRAAKRVSSREYMGGEHFEEDDEYEES